jgi:hypothetical protein
VDQIWAYRYDAPATRFVQVPVQVDERAMLDLTHGQPTPVYELTYDWLGSGNGLLDGDDEIALMARDAGDRAPDTDVWVPQAGDLRIELRIEDPLDATTGWLYLFTSPSIVDVDPSFSYVSWSGPDPNSGVASVQTLVYEIGYTGRWRLTRLAIPPGPDLLDRVKARAYALVGSETEETYERTSQMLGARSGKVRALREVQGAASGALTTHIDAFYRDIWRRTINLRVHTMSHIWYYYDYLPPPVPGRFFSSTLAPGLPIDGVDDLAPAATPPAWSQASLPAGTLVMYQKELTPFPAPDPNRSCAPQAGATFYWRDDAGINDTTGDDQAAIGNHGIHLYCTADTNTSPYSLTATHYFLPAQNPYVPAGGAYAQREENPLFVTAAGQARAPLTDPDLTDIAPAGEGRLSLLWTDALGEDSYEIYRGEILSPFTCNHDTALACGLPAQSIAWTSPDDQQTGQPSYYYLVVPRRGAQRLYGTDSAGTPLPPSASPCP